MSINEITLPDEWIDPEADLLGVDSNAFSIIGFTCRALRRAGNDSSVVTAYQEQATTGSYDELLAVSMRFCGMA